jgi:hypothetical protein
MKTLFNPNEGLYTGDEALRVTALAYLKEALIKERYEQCADLITAAKRFGATGRDIKVAIARSVRVLKAGGKIEVPTKRIFRRRF